MKKYYLMIMGLLLTANLLGQTQTNKLEKFAIIKGKVTNAKVLSENFILVSHGYFDLNGKFITLNEKGEFYEKIKIEHDFQEIHFSLRDDDIYTFYLKEKDTLNATWDETNIKQTFKISSPSVKRNKDLSLQLDMNSVMREYYDLESSSFFNLADSLKFEKINELYNKQINQLLKGGEVIEATDKIALDSYFQLTSLMNMCRMLPKYKLSLINTPKIADSVLILNPLFRGYGMLSETYFEQSEYYRNFLFNYVSRGKFEATMVVDTLNAIEKVKNKSNPTENDYYRALAELSLYKIRDWYICKKIMDGYKYYDFKDAEAVYNTFLPIAKEQSFVDTLKTYRAKISRLQSGSIAPGFSLKNEKGQMVSLSDFKGKVVYIDFWGVNCGPCIGEFQNHTPSLHKKFKDKNVVFLNICVDGDEAIWKSRLRKLNLDGINVIAQGWKDNPVCKDYYVDSIPHYVLIDKEGKIVHHNAPRPSQTVNLEKELNAILAN